MRIKQLTLISMLVALAAASQASLVAHWGMEEGAGATTLDSISSSNDALDGASWATGAFVGSSAAVDFSGATSPATRTVFSGIAGAADRTVSAWVKTSSTDRNAIIAWGASGATGALGQRSTFAVNGGALRFEIGGGFAIGTAQIADGAWHHIAISTTGTDTANTVFWVDGVLDTTAGFGNANSIDSIADWVTIGGENQPDQILTRFSGAMDELSVYDHVLTESEVGALAIPEPATLGMVAMFGGAMLFIRRKMMV